MSEVYFKDVEVLKGPVLALLKKEGYQAVDMHYHTRFSVDGLAGIKSVLAQCRKDSIGVAVTDHNHWKGADLAKKLSRGSVFTVPGLEVTCHNGAHVLLHFYEDKDLKSFYQRVMRPLVKESSWFIKLNPEEIIDRASKYNCLVTAPHPFGPGLIGVKKFKIKEETLRQIDAVEVINGCCVGKMNIRAISWAERIRKGFTGGSDGHCLAELGTALTICKADSVEEFLDQIKKRKSLVIGKEERLMEDAVHAVGKFVREEEKAPSKEIERMWKDRGLLEWNYFKKKIMGINFLHHFHSHHQELETEMIKGHQKTRHLLKFL